MLCPLLSRKNENIVLSNRSSWSPQFNTCRVKKEPTQLRGKQAAGTTLFSMQKPTDVLRNGVEDQNLKQEWKNMFLALLLNCTSASS